MTFIKTLLNTGINASDANVLEAHYSGQPEFVDGMEMIARSVGMNEQVPPSAPTGEPWKQIHAYMLGAADVSTAFISSISGFTPVLQRAITSAITTRMVQIQQYHSQFQGGTGKKKKTKDFLIALDNLGYKFRYNLCTHNVEVNGKPISDPLAAEIRNRMRDIGFEQVNIMEDAYTAHAWSNRYHPIRDYLMDLKYDGQDHIGNFASYFIDEHNVFGKWIRRWMIGACARVMAGEQNRVLVLDGIQGLGKDYIARWLASPMHEYYTEAAINPDDKDHRLRLISTWIWNASEINGTTRKADREALKSFITLQTVRERKPFGKFDIQGQTMCSFFGTVNGDGGFLSDPTGNRRFMTCHMLEIDRNYSKMNVDQIWAQAYDLYVTGEQWDLDTAEVEEANKINDIYTIDDITAQAILKYFVVDSNRLDWWMATIDLVQELEQKGLKFGSPTSASMQISRACTEIGLRKGTNQQSTKKQNRGWFGIRRF